MYVCTYIRHKFARAYLANENQEMQLHYNPVLLGCLGFASRNLNISTNFEDMK